MGVKATQYRNTIRLGVLSGRRTTVSVWFGQTSKGTVALAQLLGSILIYGLDPGRSWHTSQATTASQIIQLYDLSQDSGFPDLKFPQAPEFNRCSSCRGGDPESG